MIFGSQNFETAKCVLNRYKNSYNNKIYAQILYQMTNVVFIIQSLKIVTYKLKGHDV